MAAIEWLTMQMELQGEINDMDRAMQVSLQEAEQQEAAAAGAPGDARRGTPRPLLRAPCSSPKVAIATLNIDITYFMTEAGANVVVHMSRTGCTILESMSAPHSAGSTLN